MVIVFNELLLFKSALFTDLNANKSCLLPQRYRKRPKTCYSYDEKVTQNLRNQQLKSLFSKNNIIQRNGMLHLFCNYLFLGNIQMQQRNNDENRKFPCNITFCSGNDIFYQHFTNTFRCVDSVKLHALTRRGRALQW